jgi:Phytoene dehydrogenase and related proteins
MYLTPPKQNQSEYASHITVNCVIDYTAVEKWKETKVGNRGEEYKKWKAENIEKVITKLELLYPNIRELIEYVFGATPLTIRDYYGVKNGALYGVSKDCRNIMFSQIPINTKVKNLYLTGQNINLHGICGVPLTAVQTAETINGKDSILKKINIKTK